MHAMEKTFTLSTTVITLTQNHRAHQFVSSSKTIFPLSPHLPRKFYLCKYGTTRNSNAAVEEEEIRSTRKRRWRGNDVSTRTGVLKELVDSIWIFKCRYSDNVLIWPVQVFGFYGWWVLPVLISMLLATGPKAFLLALAVLIGLSIVALAFSKLWATVNNPKRQFRGKKRKPRGRTTSNIDIEEDEEEEQQQQTRTGYRSWVFNDDVNIIKGNEDSSNFKGWDELDGVKEFDEGRMRRSARVRRSRREVKFIRRERGGQIPLLLRLLVAVFPFLGSWTKML